MNMSRSTPRPHPRFIFVAHLLRGSNGSSPGTAAHPIQFRYPDWDDISTPTADRKEDAAGILRALRRLGKCWCLDAFRAAVARQAPQEGHSFRFSLADRRPR